MSCSLYHKLIKEAGIVTVSSQNNIVFAVFVDVMGVFVSLISVHCSGCWSFRTKSKSDTFKDHAGLRFVKRSDTQATKKGSHLSLERILTSRPNLYSLNRTAILSLTESFGAVIDLFNEPQINSAYLLIGCSYNK